MNKSYIIASLQQIYYLTLPWMILKIFWVSNKAPLVKLCIT